MACPQIFSTVGLVLGMIGVLIIFLFGPPQPSFEEGVGVGLEDGTPLGDGRTVADHNAEVRRKRRRHSILSKVGLGLVFIGFGLQLWAVWA